MFRRYLASSAVVFLVAVGLTFSTGTAAQAYSSPSPVTIGKQVLKAPPGKLLSVGVGLTPWGRAAKLGMAAYATSDIWWPVLSDALGIDGGTDVVTQAVSGKWAMNVTPNADWSTFTITVQKGASGGYSRVKTSGVTCTSAAGDTLASSTYPWVAISPNVTSVQTKTVTAASIGCGAGTALMTATFDLVSDTTYGCCKADTITLRRPWTPEDTVQTTSVQCRQPDGTLVTITDTATGYGDRVFIPSCAERVPGSIPWSGSIKAGPSALSQKVLTEWLTDQDVFGEYADCFGPSGLECSIRVYIDELPCTLDRTVCRNWRRLMDDPLTEPRVQCRFGTHIIAMEDCTSLTYKEEVLPRPVTEVDPETETPVVDPEAPKPPEEPEPKPCTVNCPNPEPPPVDPELVNPDTTSCIGAAWSWNPVAWVFVPVKCVLIWAFKPDPDFYNWDGFITQVKARPPFSVIGQLGATVQAVADGYQGASDCGVLADFTTGDIDGQITCSAVRSVPGHGILYALVQAGLFGATAFGMFKLVQRSLGGK